MKPRKISSLIRSILVADPRVNIALDGQEKRLNVQFYSSLAYADFKEKIELDIVASGILSVGKGMPYAFIMWDVRGIEESPAKPVEAYRFNDEAKRDRQIVNEQEEEIADVYGGQRHIGSGAIDGLKSDSSGSGDGAFQVENKSTRAMSFPVKISILDKITREARTQSKHPMLQVRFTNSPEWSVAEDDWFIIGRSTFEKKMRKDA